MSEKFHVPKKTLDDLNEFSGGGYILFIYDQESKPRVYANFDSPAHGLGMQKYLDNWSALVDTVNLETSLEDLNNCEEGPSDDEDDAQQNA